MTRGQTRLRDQLRDSLRNHLRNKGHPRVPEAGRVLWSAFIEISAARGVHQFGPAPIGFTDIKGWARLTGTPLAPHHVEIIRAMDEAFVEHFQSAAKDERTPEGVKTIQRSSGQPLSPALFDAALG
jgi:hypothetical protein